jgi:DNA-binding ferritin-like protein (Dps family)
MTMFISRMIGEKRRWRRYKARVKAVPEPYRSAVDAIERYLMSFGRGDGTGWAEMLEDLADLFEQAAADGTLIREIVGEDPEEFVEAFVQNYPVGQWVTREQERLTNTIARAAGEGSRNDERAV